jgi:hypothetical protein
MKKRAHLTNEAPLVTGGQQASDLGELLQSVGLGAARPIPALDVSSFDAGLPAGCLQQMFGVVVALGQFGIGDLLWAENAMRQLEGVDALRTGAQEILQQWYRDYARPHYFEKLRQQQPVSPRSNEHDEADGGICSDQRGMH